MVWEETEGDKRIREMHDCNERKVEFKTICPNCGFHITITGNEKC